jgi:hypothetical protein
MMGPGQWIGVLIVPRRPAGPRRRCEHRGQSQDKTQDDQQTGTNHRHEYGKAASSSRLASAEWTADGQRWNARKVAICRIYCKARSWQRFAERSC